MDYIVKPHKKGGFAVKILKWPSERAVHVQFDKETYCPNCGTQGVWYDDMDDYYDGCMYLCTHCQSEGCRWAGVKPGTYGQAIINAIEEGLNAKAGKQ